MKGIMFDLKMSKVLLSKLSLGGNNSMLVYRRDWPEPVICYQNQVLVKTRLGGICGTDLHMSALDISSFASILGGPEKTFPMGHELVGEVLQVGEEASSLQAGDRVVYLPGAHCEAYGFKPCPSCRRGNLESCLSLAGEGDGTGLEAGYGGRGRFGGFGGGGYCESLVGFEKQFFRVPAGMPDEIAVLTEPLAVGVHAVARHLPSRGKNVVVIGAGIIGLMVVAALRSLAPPCRLFTIARYPFQRDAAQRLGFDEVIIAHNPGPLYEKVAQWSGGRLFKPVLGRSAIFGNAGPDLIFDCVGTERTIDDALHLIQSNGKIVVLGQSYTRTKTVDWSIQTYKEIEIAGSFMYGIETIQGSKRHAFEIAIDVMHHNHALFEGLVTHTFRIDDYKDALNTVRRKSRSRAVKVAFDYR